MQGLIHRLLVHLNLGRWWFTLVDDLAGLILLSELYQEVATMLLFLMMLDYPISWPKVFVGRATVWAARAPPRGQQRPP